jgi:hypothetical protein
VVSLAVRLEREVFRAALLALRTAVHLDLPTVTFLAVALRAVRRLRSLSHHHPEKKETQELVFEVLVQTPDEISRSRRKEGEKKGSEGLISRPTCI